MESYTSEDARREWRRILNEVERGEPVGITRYGKPLAVVVSSNWYTAAVHALYEQDTRRAAGIAKTTGEK